MMHSIWTKRDRELVVTLEPIVERIFARYGKGMLNLALAESLMEKGQDNYEIACLATKGRMQADSAGCVEQVFVADGILSWLHIFTGKVAEARELLGSFKKKAEQENAKKLIPNIEVFLVRCALYEGQIDQVCRWMEQAEDEDVVFSVYERFGYLTKIRVYLMQGRYEQAIKLILKLEYYAEIAKRTYIQMELLILKAITLYRGNQEGWRELLLQALQQAEPVHFVRIFSREGAALYPLLKDSALRTCLKERKAPAFMDFFKLVLKETELMAHYYPGYLKSVQEAVSLSETALKILRLQAEGYGNEEIAKMLNMTRSNVKYHVSMLYKKLEVSNRAGAITEARKRGWL